jgi:hypothetical protein
MLQAAFCDGCTLDAFTLSVDVGRSEIVDAFVIADVIIVTGGQRILDPVHAANERSGCNRSCRDRRSPADRARGAPEPTPKRCHLGRAGR